MTARTATNRLFTCISCNRPAIDGPRCEPCDERARDAAVRRAATQPLRELVATAGLSYAELARRIGTDKAVVGRWLNGKRRPTFESARRIAEAIGVDLNVLAEVMER